MSRMVSTCIASVIIGATANPLLKFMSTDAWGGTMFTVLLITLMQVGLLLADVFPRKE